MKKYFLSSVLVMAAYPIPSLATTPVLPEPALGSGNDKIPAFVDHTKLPKVMYVPRPEADALPYRDKFVDLEKFNEMMHGLTSCEAGLEGCIVVKTLGGWQSYGGFEFFLNYKGIEREIIKDETTGAMSWLTKVHLKVRNLKTSELFDVEIVSNGEGYEPYIDEELGLTIDVMTAVSPVPHFMPNVRYESVKLKIEVAQ